MSDEKKRVLSAIQPTGDLHFGNYFGAIENWIKLQEKYECTYGVVDYHAMTMPYNAQKLKQNTWTMAFYLLACGVKVENLFLHSLIPEHAELAWILSCSTSFGELSRMTQFKDKSQQVQEGAKESFISAGLFYYPVLQAADILMYKADYVPVGKDQIQHLELSRNIAQRFNNQYGVEYFTAPDVLLTATPKIMSPALPTKKMSKSLGEKHYVNLFAEDNKIRKQIRSAVTDTGETKGDEMSAGVANLFELLQACGKKEAHASLMADYKASTLKYSDLKVVVGDALVEIASGCRERLKELNGNKKEVKSQIMASSWEIRKKAQQTIKEVRSIVGLQKLRY